MAKKTSNTKKKQTSTKARYKAELIKNAKKTGSFSKAKSMAKTGTAADYRNARNMQNSSKYVSKKVLWISLAACAAVAIIIIAVIIIFNNQKNNSSNNSANNAAGNASNISANNLSDSSANDSANASDFNYDDNSADDSLDGYVDPSSIPTLFYSEAITENGFWRDTRALDYVELVDYQSISIPTETHEISNGDIMAEVYNLIDNFGPETKQIKNRAVADGDKVNIDYVGSVDGVEFDGGSTFGEGTDITAGSSNYIDDFLTQIIGHKPGETINVEVTFPEDYGQDQLNGKDAVFVTTINYINEYNINDNFIYENLYNDYGWQTINDMETEIRYGMQRTFIENYINEYITSADAVSSEPENIIAFQTKRIEYEEEQMVNYYQGYAEDNGMDLDTFLQSYVGVSGLAEMVEISRNNIVKDTKRSLVAQAIAEDAGISVNMEDMEYFMPDYLSYIDQYGLPWLAQYVLGLKVVDYLVSNAVLA